MDDCRFDNWTRMVSGQADRRSAVKGLAGGAAALLTLAKVELGIAQDADVVIENNCKGSDAKCRKDKECCSKQCKKKRRGRQGRCVCASVDQGCKRDQGCCSGRCNGTQCECGGKSDPCRKNGDCCSNICTNQKCECIKQGNRCDTTVSGRQCCSGRCNSNGFCN